MNNKIYQQLIKTQTQINNLRQKETKLKKEFLQSLKMGEEFIDLEGNTFKIVGFQVEPTPQAIIQFTRKNYNGQQAVIQDLNWICESFISITSCQDCGKPVEDKKAFCMKCEDRLNKETKEVS